MAVFKNTAEVGIRENRLSAIQFYDGTLKDLVDQSKEKKLSNKCGSYEQCGICAQENALSMVAWIKGAAVINHAPVGCGLCGIQYADKPRSDTLGQDRHIWQIISNIDENDTIYGASEKLRKAIDEADKRFNPTVTFILSSCVGGIIGEDLESIANEAEEKYGYPIVPIYCEGFKSKMWSSGFDAGYHGILRKLVKKPEKKQGDLVNIINFIGDDRLRTLLEKADLRANYATAFSTLEDLQNLAAAACTVTFCDTLSTYVSAVLEEQYDVKRVTSPPPFGVKWTDDWLTEIGEITGHQKQVAEVIKEEHEKIDAELEYLRSELKGKKVYVMSGDTFAFQLANIVADLGMEVVGISPLHHDQKLDDGDIGAPEKLIKVQKAFEDVPVHVCPRQPHVALKHIKEAKPDILICRHNGVVAMGIMLGIPTLVEGNRNFSIAYDGIISLGRRALKALKTRRFVENIAEHVELPYTDWWLDQ